MSERRSTEQLSAEYGKLCQQAGHLNYQIHAISKDLELVNEQLRELNLEAAANQQAAQSEAAAAAHTAAASAPVSEVPAVEAVVTPGSGS